MLRFIITKNAKLASAIAAKMITKYLRKSCSCGSAKVTINDAVVDTLPDDKLMIHVNGDLEITATELMELINSKLDND